jgi:two-component system, response regulator PdtaR
MEMPRYFSDLDDGKTRYVDVIGTELADERLVSREAIGFLASVFNDILPDKSDHVFVVSVRNEVGRPVFATTLTLQSDWLDAGHVAAAKTRPVVLVVEDDPLSRMSAAVMIGNAGCDVVEVGDADEAIAVLEARQDIQVVFTDIRMPGSMDGLKLARYVRKRWPPIKIIATSGHLAVLESDLPEGGVFLSKPYDVTMVATVLQNFNVGAA